MNGVTTAAEAINDLVPESESKDLVLDDFYADMRTGKFIYLPSGESWPAGSVNARVPEPEDGVSPSDWLKKNRPIEQVAWWPGMGQVIKNQLVNKGGWFDHPGATVLNVFLPSTIKLGDAAQAQRWIDHVGRIYPNDADHIIRYFAFKVQSPGAKINHALVLGGAQGIGKDTIIEPVKAAAGHWNCDDVSRRVTWATPTGSPCTRR